MNKGITLTNPYKVGDILVSSWGYSMLIVQFYEVTKVTAKKVGLVELKTKEKPSGFLSGTTVPVLGQYVEQNGGPNRVGDGRLFKVSDGGCVIIPDYPGSKSHIYARKWDGKPKSYDYCD